MVPCFTCADAAAPYVFLPVLNGVVCRTGRYHKVLHVDPEFEMSGSGRKHLMRGEGGEFSFCFHRNGALWPAGERALTTIQVPEMSGVLVWG